MDRFSKNILILMDWALKKIFLKERGFRGGSDEKMRRMWLGLGFVVVGLPPLTHHYEYDASSVLNRDLRYTGLPTKDESSET